MIILPSGGKTGKGRPPLKPASLTDAQWFTREHIRSGLLEKHLQLLTNISVSHRLVAGWYDEGQLGSLGDIVLESVRT